MVMHATMRHNPRTRDATAPLLLPRRVHFLLIRAVRLGAILRQTGSSKEFADAFFFAGRILKT